MLQKLHIQNYVLIEDLEIQFAEGLTIITGETGAGKSILLGALSLILGQRADSAVLRDKSKKCIIEGHFDIKGYNLEDFFILNELDFEPNTNIRREISHEGKSRAFINDTPVNLNQLRELASGLVDIHSQHETLTLQNAGFQLSVVDEFSKHKQLLASYKNDYKQFRQLQLKLDELITSESKSKIDLDYFQFQFNELEQAALKPGEEEMLQQELATLNNAEEIKLKLNMAIASLSAGDANTVYQLENISSQIRSVSKYNPQIDGLANRLKSALIEVKDIAAEMESLEQEISGDKERLEVVSERLNMIFNLQQKHRVNSISQLVLLKEQLAENLLKINSLEDEISNLSTLKDKQKELLIIQGGTLSENREEAGRKIEKEIKGMLTDLGMPHGNLRIELTKTDQLTETGMDKIRFLFSANKGVPLQELGKVASGGEMGRLMLCIKSLMARLVTLPTIVFDEIDTGISGEIAFKTGSIIEKISSKHQVMVITHLPQMASRGDAHLLVYKKTKGKTTNTGIRLLNQDERISEIAKMLSGEALTEAAVENAKELLGK